MTRESQTTSNAERDILRKLAVRAAEAAAEKYA